VEQILGLLGMFEPHLFKALFFIWRCCSANIVVPGAILKGRGIVSYTRGVGEKKKKKKFSKVTG